jgi:hypothetical protein
MTTELKAVSSFGWFVEPTVNNYQFSLKSVSSFGWYLDIDGAIEDGTLIAIFDLCVAREILFELNQ